MAFGPIRDKMEFRPQMFWKRALGLAARDDQKRGYDFNYSGDNSIKKPQDAYFLRQVKPEQLHTVHQRGLAKYTLLGRALLVLHVYISSIEYEGNRR